MVAWPHQSVARLGQRTNLGRPRYGATVTANAADLTEPDVAVMFDVPTSRAVISPLFDTVATTVLLDDQVNAAPGTTLPDAS
jgi:hypothetical protein